MPGILVPLLAGVLGTAAMSFLLLLPAWLGLPRVDLVRAMGSYVTGNRETAFTPGIIIHFLVGILFGYVYYWGFRYTLVPLTPLHGLFAGAVHGTLIMLFVSIAVLEHHPDKRYQRRGADDRFRATARAHCLRCRGRRGLLAARPEFQYAAPPSIGEHAKKVAGQATKWPVVTQGKDEVPRHSLDFLENASSQGR